MGTWIAELATQRFGDWIIVEADDEEHARRLVRKKTRRPIAFVSESIPTRVRLAETDGVPVIPGSRRRRR